MYYVSINLSASCKWLPCVYVYNTHQKLIKEITKPQNFVMTIYKPLPTTSALNKGSLVSLLLQCRDSGEWYFAACSTVLLILKIHNG